MMMMILIHYDDDDDDDDLIPSHLITSSPINQSTTPCFSSSEGVS